MSRLRSVPRPLGWALFAAALALFPTRAAAQEPVTITGKVTGATGESLRDVNVTIFELGIGVWTSADGTYRLNVPGARAAGQQVRVTARLIGFRAQSNVITLAPGATLEQSFQLAADPLRLEEIVVTGAGTEQRRERLGVSSQSVDSSTLQRTGESNVIQSLAGKVPGVLTNQGSGDAGASTSIQIRGAKTFGTSQPVMILDGVPIANNGGSNSVAVAEHTIMLILAVYKKMAWHHINVTHGKWRVGDFAETRTYELAGKKLGIVGLGTIGKKVARRAAAFDMKIVYYDIVRLAEDAEDALGVRFVLLPELLRTADIVSLHVPLNAVTRNMFGARELGMMRPSAVLINTCRGPVVDENALHTALTTKAIAAAGLDVMVEEPPIANHPLFALENVTFTPHTAGPTWDNWFKAFRNAFDNVQRVARGERPLWVIPELR